jgi:uncharacterized protein (TIGR02145 family)
MVKLITYHADRSHKINYIRMRNKNLLIIGTFSVAMLLFACGNRKNPFNKTEPQILKGITIGTQIWATENLFLSTFRNGDPIPEAKTVEEWLDAGNAEKPIWCYYNNDPAIGSKYGILYNWYAVGDPRGLAPEGWHIPGYAEWNILTDFLGGKDIAGQKLKAAEGWYNNGNGSNESGFAGFPGGYRSNEDGSFRDIGRIGFWWSAQDDRVTPLWAYGRSMGYNFNNVTYDGISKVNGLSIRCIMD